MKNILLSLIFLSFILSCNNSREKYLELKKSEDFVLWKNSETITENDFIDKRNHGASNVAVKIMTGIFFKQNKLEYFVYFDKSKSFLNVNQPKDTIQDIISYVNIKMDVYELEGRNYVEKFKNRENIKIENNNQAKYITNEIVANADLKLEEISQRIWNSKRNRDTIKKVKFELSEKLKNSSKN